MSEDKDRPEMSPDDAVMESIKQGVMKLNAALELASRRDINIQLTLHTMTRAELNVPSVSLTLDAANKSLYHPMIVRPH
jgi:hypothetical protein